MRLLLALAVALVSLPALAASTADLSAQLSRQISRCWHPAPGASGSVTVRFELSPDGGVVGTPRVTGLASAGFAAGAINAVKLCQPYRLPPARYSDWQHAVVKLSIGAGG
jgi:hypothetical protein